MCFVNYKNYLSEVMIMTSAPQALNREYTALKKAVEGFNASTPLATVNQTTTALRNLQKRIQVASQNNSQAVMALALSQKNLPKLISRCEALLRSDDHIGAVLQPEAAPAPVALHLPAGQSEAVSSKTDRVAHTVTVQGSQPMFARPAIGRSRKPQTAPKTQLQSSQGMVEAQAVVAPPVTEIRVRCRVPFGHTLTIRGQGGDLNWSSGKVLTQIDPETWAIRFKGLTGPIEYKLLLDDCVWEAVQGNRSIEAEKTQDIVPVLSFPKVAVIVNCDVPGDTKLFIRGTAEGMSWSKGIELKRVDGKFVLESDRDLGRFEFKILRDDQHWSQGDNFVATAGETLEITPRF